MVHVICLCISGVMRPVHTTTILLFMMLKAKLAPLYKPPHLWPKTQAGCQKVPRVWRWDNNCKLLRALQTLNPWTLANEQSTLLGTHGRTSLLCPAWKRYIFINLTRNQNKFHSNLSEKDLTYSFKTCNSFVSDINSSPTSIPSCATLNEHQNPLLNQSPR